MVRVRFAPSPTGPLHIGGVRTALFNYLFAKKNKGKIILRIEDTDQTRYVNGAEDYICDSLDWCGIKFDEGIREGGDYGPYKQSERADIYKKYADILLQSGHAYMAFDTPEELAALRERAEKEGKSFLYNYETRKSLKNSISLSSEQVEKLISENTAYVIRFKIPEDETVNMQDIIRGEVSVNTKELDDKVLMKTDGLPTYHLANIVDDHLMEITHVIRGEEWLPSLALHVLLYNAFGWQSPQFAHLPLILKPNGKGKLSKRDGDNLGFPVFPTEWTDEKGELYNSYRAMGYFPEAFVNMLALLGWNPGTDQEIFTMQELIEAFTLEKAGNSGSRFDPEKTKWFNHQYMVQKNADEIADHFMPLLKEKGIEVDRQKAIKICELIKDRISLLSELYNEASLFFVAPKEYDEQFMKKAIKEESPEALKNTIKLLSTIEDFSATNLETQIKAYLEKEEIPFGKIMPALRLALVGKGSGPAIFDIMEILGKDQSINRLERLWQEL